MSDPERIARLRRALPPVGWSAIDLDVHLLAIVRMIDAAEALTSDARASREHDDDNQPRGETR